MTDDFQNVNTAPDVGLSQLISMLDPAKPIGECSPQELVVALMLKGAFNQFDPEQVLSDLSAHQEWWKSFVMGPPLPEDTRYLLDRVLIALRDLGYRWKADTL